MERANDKVFREEMTAHGFYTFPCRNKIPLTEHGVKDAQLSTWPHHRGQLGIACGKLSGITVLDIDVDGSLPTGEVLRILSTKECPFENVVRTPSGGYHIYLAYEPAVTNRVRAMGMPLDVRTDGGYVIAPTGDYRVLRWDWNFRPMPERLVKPLIRKPLVIDPAPVKGDAGALERFVADSQEGERNHRLFWAACRMIENGDNPSKLIGIAQGIGLDQKEIEKTIKSAVDNTSRAG